MGQPKSNLDDFDFDEDILGGAEFDPDGGGSNMSFEDSFDAGASFTPAETADFDRPSQRRQFRRSGRAADLDPRLLRKVEHRKSYSDGLI